MSKAREIAPCGHTREQAAWLGCTDSECRANDARIVKEYQAWVKAGRPGDPGQRRQ